MFTTLAMVGPFIIFAWVLQYFLNQLIADDLESLRQSQSADEASVL